MKSDELKQTLSEWMDGELDDTHDVKVVKACSDSAELSKSFESYHIIRAALNNETSSHWHAGFSQKVAEALDNEPTVLAPRRRSQQAAFKGWAVAASVALAVVLGAQWWPTSGVAPSGNSGEQFVSQNNSQVKNVADNDTMIAEYHLTNEEQAQLERIDAIFSQYADEKQTAQGSKPYVRLVSGEQVKTFRMTPRQFRQVMAELEKQNREAEQKAKQEQLKQ
ncbi:MAG: sigma-E factor negative regulatory protein [Gammaproteobacteria bacterium]|nr:sigma-E factor negative regulatory protein [Gammaproteobacteria bacterium]